MKKFLTVISLTVFALGAAAFVYASREKNSVFPARSFVIAYTTTRVIDGKPKQEASSTLTQTVDGNWKKVTFYQNGEPMTQLGTADSIYKVRADKLELSSRREPNVAKEEAFRSAYFHKHHPEFVRIEYVAGLKTYVHRTEQDGRVVEFYYAPEIGSTPLKFSVSGGGEDYVVEAVTVQFRDVSAQEVAVPDLPVVTVAPSGQH